MCCPWHLKMYTIQLFTSYHADEILNSFYLQLFSQKSSPHPTPRLTDMDSQQSALAMELFRRPRWKSPAVSS